MTEYSFRTAQVKDAPLLEKLVNSAYRGESSRKGWTTEADFLEGQRIDQAALSEMILGQDQFILLAFNPAEKLCGCVYLRKQDADKTYLGMVTVDPEIQNAGIGRAILNQAEEFARKEMCSQALRMNVIPLRTELLAWYERRGYQRTGETEKFPYGDERFGIPKRQDLNFVVLEKTL